MKRFISMLIIIILIFSVMNSVALAETTSSIYSNDEIEALVRTKLSIDNEIKLNYSNLYTQDTREKKLWNLEFAGEKANMHVTVDAETGEVINFNSWGNHLYGKPVAILSDAAKENAVKFIQSLEPEKFKETEAVTVEAPSMILFQLKIDYYEPDNYHFLFVRKMKGEYFPNNYFKVQVSGTTGNIVQYEMRWDEAAYDNDKALISEEQARKIFEKEDRLQLKYVRLYNNNKDETTKAVLTPVYVYAPKESDKINAIDGRLYKMEDVYYQWPDYRPMYGTSMDREEAKEAMASGGGEVIPEKGVISKEKAERIVIDTLGKELDLTGLKVQNSQYTNYYFGLEGKYWNIYWWDEENGKYLHAGVDAESGDIISASFSKSLEHEEPVAIERISLIKQDVAAEPIAMEVDEEELEGTYRKPEISNKDDIDETKIKSEILDKMRAIFPHIKEGEIDFEAHSNIAEESQIYVVSPRLIDGIPYDENYLNVTYQYTTGEIVKFDYQWNKVEAQPASKVIDKKVIEKQFYDTVGFEKYLIQLKNQTAATKEGKNIPLKQLVPVYALKTFNFSFIDATSGKFLNHDGKEYVEESLISGFKDVNNHPYEKEILLMDKMGVLKEDSQSFRPDESLARKDAMKWIVEMGWKGRFYSLDGYYDYYQKAMELPFKDIDRNDPYYVYVVAAVENGIIDGKEDYFNPEEKMTKMEVTKWLLNAMKQKQLAQFTEIFQVSYTDKDKIQSEDIGYVALAKYYNIYGDKEGEEAFKPEQVFTRGEFIKALYNMLNNQ
ncbi:S-layer homology domain-containing protein [Anaerovirgula multivorans]|uniref:S-layer homology domain-containing protein n=1 Tax=Anaerovirgula multivorans TaxID=312168 RepID=A0A239B8H2_9FIRM|nr:S-layer homology domain-containing protein [Anaerovirgula multivorans]SNS04210.1 S-layer homology domain-containing protein [Anaerovirgula multivorans]